MNAGLSRFLDFARWIAAFLVLVTHLNNRMLRNLSDIPSEDRNLITYGWGFFTGFGHHAVMVFFVLSGYLVGGKLLESIASGKPISLRKYAVDRIVRIYAVFLPVLFLVAILDGVGWFGLRQYHIYNDYNISDHYSWIGFLGNILNLQGVFVPYWGTNGPLGTLANEFWYYVSFPLIIYPWIAPQRKLLGGVFFGVGISIVIGWSIFSPAHGVGFIVWCIGAFAALCKRPLVRGRFLAVAIFLVGVSLVRIFLRADFFENSPMIGPVIDFFVALCFVNCILAFKYSERPPGEILRSNIHKYMADFSYSMYAVHASLITFVCAALDKWTGFGWREVPIEMWHWGVVIMVLLGVIFISRILAMFTEDKSIYIKSAAYRMSGVSRAIQENKKPQG